jgi:hypothetical protein
MDATAQGRASSASSASEIQAQIAAANEQHTASANVAYQLCNSGCQMTRPSTLADRAPPSRSFPHGDLESAYGPVARLVASGRCAGHSCRRSRPNQAMDVLVDCYSDGHTRAGRWSSRRCGCVARVES